MSATASDTPKSGDEQGKGPGASSPLVDELLTVREVTAWLKISQSTLFRWITDYGFPQGERLAPKCLRFRRCDINDWRAQRQRDAA